MRAVCWNGKLDVRVQDVPEPSILNPTDAIVKVSSTAICGSDLHLYGGFIPTMRKGDIIGHEFMGEVVETGPEVHALKRGDRVVVPFAIACGHCGYCKAEQWSLCDNSNPNAGISELLYGFAGSGLFGYSHMFGGYAGGQAEYVRVPYANVGPVIVPDSLPDEKVLFLGDVLPTGYMAAEYCEIQPGQTVAVWGCGPVGLMAIKFASLLGAGRVIAIDRFPERLELAQLYAKATPINYEEEKDVVGALKDMTGGEGPEACIDAVGMEAHAPGPVGFYDTMKQRVKLQTDRPHAFRQVLQACRKGGIVSVPGVYGGIFDKVPMGAAFSKGLTLKMGQTHVHRYMRKLLALVEEGVLDPTFMVSHIMKLEEAPEAYRMFREKRDRCVKIVLKP